MISRVGDSFARGTRKGSCNFKERCTTVMKSDGENWGRLSKDFVRIVAPDFFNLLSFPPNHFTEYIFEYINLRFCSKYLNYQS